MSDKSQGSRSASTDEGVQAFIDDLHNAPAGGHILHGMVKPAEAPDGVMFAHVGGCDHWAYIPATAILSIRGTGRTACKGHSHATAEIELKAPNSDLEAALVNVAHLHQASLLQLQASVSWLTALNPCPPGQHMGKDQYGNPQCQAGY